MQNDIAVSTPAPISVLSRRLAVAQTPQEFADIAQLAELAQHWAIRARVAQEQAHHYGVIRLDALRALGTTLDQMTRARRGRPKNIPGGILLPKLPEILGVEPTRATKLAYIARHLAAIAEPTYRKYIAEAVRNEWTVSPNDLREFAAPIGRSQGFTDKSLAKRLYQLTLVVLSQHGVSIDEWIEPGAGDGAFYDLLPPGKRTGIDIDPRRDDLIAGDFMDFDAYKSGISYCAIGNPPWTNNGCVRFFNHAAKFCTVIAFMLPRAFEGEHLKRQLDPRFKLLHQESLPVTQFRFGQRGRVFASLFQIWVRSDVGHRPALPQAHEDFEFLPRDADHRKADIIMRRVGTDAGRILHDGEVPSIANSHLIRVTPGADVDHVRARLRAINWDNPRYIDPAIGHAERAYKTISMSDVVQGYDRVTEKDVWKHLTRSLIKQGEGEDLRRCLDELLTQ